MLIGNEKLICLTPEAGLKINDLMERESKGNYLRIKITGGGCNGLSYKMKFVTDAKPKDILVESSGRSFWWTPRQPLISGVRHSIIQVNW